jgi:hypothetical protein
MSEDIARLWREAEIQLSRRNFEQARATLIAIVSGEPRHAPAWLHLSGLASMRGAFRESVAAAINAARVVGSDPALRMHVADRLLSVGEHRLGKTMLDGIHSTRLPAQALIEAARLSHRIGEQQRALELVDRAAALGARGPDFYYFRATLRLFCGKAYLAEDDLFACLREAPDHAAAYWTLSKLRRWTPADNHVDAMRSAAAKLAPHDPREPHLQFALFKELDDLGDTKAAWRALVRGCVAKQRTAKYDSIREKRLYQRLMDLTTREFLASAAGEAVVGPVPIFIVGLPRSGTSLLERMLGAHSQVSDAGELDDFPLQVLWCCDHQSRDMLDEHVLGKASGIDYPELGRRYLDHTQWRAAGKPFYTDKEPRNFMQVGFIHRALPQAKILHMARDPMDACFSNLKELFGHAHSYSYSIHDVATHYGNYRQLMAHWHRQLPGRIFDISYEALVADPERVMRGVLSYCGIPWEAACIDVASRTSAVSTASSAQVREAVHSRFIGQWKRYERQLQPLRMLLSEYIR